MLVSSFNLSQSFNYTPYLFYKKRLKSEINSFCIWAQERSRDTRTRQRRRHRCKDTEERNEFLNILYTNEKSEPNIG